MTAKVVTKSQKEAALLQDVDKFIGQINVSIEKAYSIPIFLYWEKMMIPYHVHDAILKHLREAGWAVDHGTNRNESFWKLS